MRLTQVKAPKSREEILAGRPKRGDVVRYMNQEYVVDVVGLRYLYAHQRGKNKSRQVLLKMEDVTKSKAN